MTRTKASGTRAARHAAELAQHTRRAHLLVTAGITVVISLVYLGVVLASRGALPGTMATHFGVGGAADGFMSTPAALLVQGVAVIGVPAALLLVFGVGQWWRGQGARQVSALVAGLGAGLTTLFVTITLRHVGVEDPAAVALDWRAGALAIGCGAAVALLAALVLPPALPRPPAAPVEPLAIAPSDRVSWFGRARTSRAALIVLALGVVAIAAAALGSGIWWLWLAVALLVLLVLGVTSFGVTVDAHGVAWRSALGVPRGRVALKDIRSVAVTEVNPGDFGGFGVRALPGRLGLITRSGRALSVLHQRGELVITVDDADMAASVVEGLRSRARR